MGDVSVNVLYSGQFLLCYLGQLWQSLSPALRALSLPPVVVVPVQGTMVAAEGPVVATRQLPLSALQARVGVLRTDLGLTLVLLGG